MRPLSIAALLIAISFCSLLLTPQALAGSSLYFCASGHGPSLRVTIDPSTRRLSFDSCPSMEPQQQENCRNLGRPSFTYNENYLWIFVGRIRSCCTPTGFLSRFLPSGHCAIFDSSEHICQSGMALASLLRRLDSSLDTKGCNRLEYPWDLNRMIPLLEEGLRNPSYPFAPPRRPPDPGTVPASPAGPAAAGAED